MQPTVTDANLALGRLDGENFLGSSGAVALDAAAALDALTEPPPPPDVTEVLLINQPVWRPRHDRWFDVPNLSAPPSTDPIHQALRLFMQRYLGMRIAFLGPNLK